MAENIIDVDALQVRFGDFEAVKGISFHVKRGEIFGFLGPNGAGKTTTIKVLTTLLHKTAGKVSLGGKSLEGDTHEVRALFGIVFQDQSLDDDLTAFENLDFHGALYHVPKEKRREKIREVLQLVELADRQHDLVSTFSGGMKRRLEIARAFVHVPRIIFLDEPTLGLDPQTRNHMWNYIKNLNKERGVTVFFTTHYMEEAARMADRIAIIDHGAIVAEGTPDALKSQTQTESLEDAFLSLTGSTLRSEEAGSLDALRQGAKMWRGTKR